MRSPFDISVSVDPLRSSTRAIADLAKMSLADPADGVPDQTWTEANLREADAGSPDYCGNCRYFNTAPELGGAGTCVIVTGGIDHNDLCNFHEKRANPATGIIPASAEEVPDEVEVPGNAPDPLPGVEIPVADIEPLSTVVLDRADFGYDPNGVIITLEPTDAEAEAIAIPGQVPAEAIHLTLVWLGSADDSSLDRDAIMHVIFEVTEHFGPLEGSISGLGTFGENPDDLLIALVDVPGLTRLRERLVHKLKEHGVDVPEDRGFTPHITLARSPIPEQPEVVGLPLTFNDITLRWGVRVIDVALVGGEPTEEAASDMAWIVVANSPDCIDESGGDLPHAVWNWETDERDGCFAEIEEAAMRAEELNEAMEEIEEVEEEVEEDLPEMPVDVSEPMDEVPPPGDGMGASDEVEHVFARGGVIPQPARALAVLAERDEKESVVGTAIVKIIPEIDFEGFSETVLREIANRVHSILNPEPLVEGEGSEFTEVVEGDADGIEKDGIEVAEGETAVLAAEEAVIEDDAAAAMTAIAPHDTAVVDEPWDADAVVARVESPSDEDYFGQVYAWRDDEADVTVKSNYRFPHHEVAEDGTPGAANVAALIAGIAVLNGARGGSTIPDADRQGVYDHLAAHLADADREPPELLALDAITEIAVDEEPVEAAADEEFDLTEVTDDELVNEIARRWAESTAEEIVASAAGSDDEDGGADASTEDTTEAVVEDTAEAAQHEDDDEAAAPTTAYEWEGVLIVEGLPSGDGRQIKEGALTHRELPIPLMLQVENAMGHDGSRIAGSIHEIERIGQEIIGRGKFDSGVDGQEAKRLISEGTMRGVSADIDSVIVEFVTPEGESVDFEDVIFGGVEAIEMLVEGRIMGATITPFPAFQEAYISVIESGDITEALVASGYRGDVWTVGRPINDGEFSVGGRATLDLAALVASAATDHLSVIPVNPPQAWFSLEEMSEPEPFTVYADGRVYGLVAQFGSCHIGFSKRCVPVPQGGAPFKKFRNKNTLTEDGDLIATGPVYMDTVHPDLRKKASDTQAFYAHTGCAVADVALYENEWGIVAAGSLRPNISPEQARTLRGSDISPDWREVDGKLQVVGLLAVNVSGFIVDGLVASGGQPIETSQPRGLFDSVTGEVRSLVAAGMVRHADFANREEIDDLRSEVAELREAIRPYRAERAAARVVRMALVGEQAVSEGETVESVEASTEDVAEAATSCACEGESAEACACVTS